jgi:hypothetical protein
MWLLRKCLVRLARIERATYSFGGCHSIQLSYRRMGGKTWQDLAKYQFLRVHCGYAGSRDREGESLWLSANSCEVRHSLA